MDFRKILDLRLGFVIPIILGLFVYSNIFRNEFVIDDQVFITNWGFAHDFSNIHKFFLDENTPEQHKGVYRPVRAVLYAVSYKLWGTNPIGYHIQSLVIHVTSIFLVYLIAQEITQKRSIGFLTSLLFTVHPVHTEAITYITANFDIAGVLFAFASFYFYIKARKQSTTHFALLVTSYAFALFAFLTYELTLMLPFIIILYEFLFKKKNTKYQILDTRYFIPYFIILSGYLFVRFFLLHIIKRGDFEYLGGSLFLTFLTMTKAFTKYLFLLFWPYDLSVNQKVADGIYAWINPLSKQEGILSQNIFDPYSIFSIAIIFGLFFLALRYFKKFPLVTFSSGWFFLALLPVSFIIPQGSIMQERYLYFASFGFFLLAAFLINYLLHLVQKPNKILVGIGLCIVVVALGGKTYLRNKDWKDELTVWATLAKQIPDDVIANLNTAFVYLRKNDEDGATIYFKKALLIEDRLPEAYFELGKILEKQGDIDTATGYYKKAAEYFPADNLQSAKAAEAFKAAIVKQLVVKGEWKNVSSPTGLSFSYPKDWKLKDFGRRVLLTYQNGQFAVEFLLSREEGVTDDVYMAGARRYGSLVEEGRAGFPDVEQAYIRIWDDAGVKKYQFFLFKDKTALEIVVWPADSNLIEVFDYVGSSLKIE